MLGSAVIWSSSLLAAYLCCRGTSTKWTTFLVSVLTVWAVLLIIPVHVLAGLQLLGILRRVTIAEAAWLSLLLLIVSAMWRGRHATDPTHICQSYGQRIAGKLPTYFGLSAGIIACSYLLFAVNLWTSYPNGSDALSYHLPLAVSWLQTGSFRIATSNAWQFTLPGNCEIAMMLALATKHQSLAPAVNLLALVCLAISTYCLGRRLADQGGAYAATLMVLTIPIVEFQAFSGYVDLFGVAFLAAAFELFLCVYDGDGTARQNGRADFSVKILWFSALACGLSLGTKTANLPYCAFYFAIVVYRLWRDRPLHKRSCSMLVAVVAIGMLAPSALWFTRSLAATGNPVYPVEVTLRGRTLLRGYDQVHGATQDLLIYMPPGGTSDNDRRNVRSRWEWWIYPWTEWLSNPGVFPIVYGEASGLGGVFATFAMIGVAVALYQWIRGRALHGLAKVPSELLLLLLAWLVIWMFGMHRVLRFGLPIWVLGCLLAAPLICSLNASFPRALGILFVASVLATCVVSSLAPLHDLLGRFLHHGWSRAQVYDYPTFIDHLPAGSNVLNDSVFPEKTFALAGSRLNNQVTSAFEVPKELTQSFLWCRKVDYVVQITAANEPVLAGDSSIWHLIGKEVFRDVRKGTLWRIFQVARPVGSWDSSPCLK